MGDASLWPVSHSRVVSQVADSNGEFFLKSSELFESPVYLEEVADVLCILQAGKKEKMSFCLQVHYNSTAFNAATFKN